ncbi:hypothetical protein ACS0TY_021953 [Phlomoides rotata]
MEIEICKSKFWTCLKFAKIVFDNPKAASLFKRRAWVSIGPKYEFKEILITILSQIDNHKSQLVSQGAIGDVFEYVHTSLKGERYLIVLDDVRETVVWEYLRKLFPDENNGSRVVLTTHLDANHSALQNLRSVMVIVVDMTKSTVFVHIMVRRGTRWPAFGHINTSPPWASSNEEEDEYQIAISPLFAV